ncbi:preprotein translocase subunit SecE [Neisseria animalis]|uniref:Protein translocase subunit SecE n=1 Tax=Neisseria animalis TaxID=492 RepID=A0A5P3MS56_NEIAN|nr:preprotein translocase subunit SecE [Neisseria animalis]QEY23935.1 preprotein translocase subunit SecE [Neisseria animalis]ROW31672.1 preprotein translocase subunit SecE [Neisseria animalis]VEE05901.1 preprotein translocase subunit SecE [Neisseria animalis]
MTERISEDKAEKQGQLMRSSESSSAPKREGLFAYFRSSWTEFKKVVWPKRDDAVKMTIFVVIFVALLSIFIYGVDSVISWLFFDILLKRG